MRYWAVLTCILLAGTVTGWPSGQGPSSQKKDKRAAPAMTARPPFNVGLSVPDAEKTARWYEENLGLARLKTAAFPKGKAIILGSSSIVIEIIQHDDATDARKRLDIREDYLAQGIFKFGFYVDNLDETVARLKQRKVRFYYEHGNDEELGLRFAIIADEDGNTIQLFEPAPAKTMHHSAAKPATKNLTTDEH